MAEKTEDRTEWRTQENTEQELSKVHCAVVTKVVTVCCHSAVNVNVKKFKKVQLNSRRNYDCLKYCQ